MRDHNWVHQLACPHCGTPAEMRLNPAPDEDALPREGEAACDHCNAHFEIRDGILDLAQREDERALTLAGRSNFLPLLPWVYEKIWRPNALSTLSGEKFSQTRELRMLNDWVRAQPHELILDLGSSTSLYARGIAKSNDYLGDASPTIVAIDMAPGMLRAGNKYAHRENLHNIAHIRANVEHLPFGEESTDALVCGGSLNEFRSMQVALTEAHRVCKSGGRMVTMSLLAATGGLGSLGQAGARSSGIAFPTLDAFNQTISETGWNRTRQEIFGTVAFTLLKK